MTNFIKLCQLSCIGFVFFLASCDSEKKPSTEVNTTTVSKVNTPEKPVNKATKILQETIKAHGGKLYDSAYYQFTFRDKSYRFKNAGTTYTYESSQTKENQRTEDKFDNGVFSRRVNDQEVELTEKQTAGGIGAINSVIYFATLPHKLNDDAVNVSYVEETIIKNEPYDVLKVTFAQEGGGEDFEDEYHYWIHQNTKKIDYLAYNYKVNGGGVRFRSAYNRRVIDGITFQDYINYKAEVGTPLKELPALYEAGKLTEISKIETQHIINLNNNL